MRDDYWTLSFPRLTQDASGDFYPDTKDDTMTTDQPTSPLPDLSRWHPVPAGATIPAGTSYVIIWGNDDFSSYVADPPGITQRLGKNPRYTPHPIPADVYVDIVFDGPPDHEAGRFVEVEKADGSGVKLGNWVERGDGYWALRITREDIGGVLCDTPPTPIDPADIKVGMRIRRVHARGPVVTVEGIVDYTDKESLTVEGMYLCHDLGDWFMLAGAPDPDAHWIRAIAEATPETAATVYAAIKGEQP